MQNSKNNKNINNKKGTNQKTVDKVTEGCAKYLSIMHQTLEFLRTRKMDNGKKFASSTYLNMLMLSFNSQKAFKRKLNNNHVIFPFKRKTHASICCFSVRVLYFFRSKHQATARKIVIGKDI